MIKRTFRISTCLVKVVKYWDDFTSGGDGAKVLAEQGKGINEDEPVDGGENPNLNPTFAFLQQLILLQMETILLF